MKKSAFTVSVPEPCHENWNEMTPKEQGRFCAVCTKTVVDFSAMTDTELFNVLKNGSGNMCGHFHQEQLHRVIVQPAKPKWFFQPFWKYFMGMLLFFKAPSVKAQGKPVCTPVVTPPTHVTMGIVAVDPRTREEKEITGKVVNSDNQPVAGAVVNIKGIKRYTVSDTKGNFKIKAHSYDMIEVSDLQYETATQRVNSENNITIILKKAETRYFVDGEMMIMQQPDPVTVSITVVDEATGEPVTNAQITWNEFGNKRRTENVNKKGKMATKTFWTGDLMDFTATAAGYQVASVSAGKAGKRSEIRIEMSELYVKPIIMGKMMVSPTVKGDVKVCAADSAKTIPVTVTPPVDQHGAEKNMPLKIIPVESIALGVYPNPAEKNGTVKLLFTGTEAGTYMAQFLDGDGKILFNHRFEAAKGPNQVSVILPGGLNAGVLAVKLMNSTGKWIATEQVVVQ